MCGIAGYISIDQSKNFISQTQEIVSMLKHRGPDGSRVSNVNIIAENGLNVCLGFTRLAIRDVSNRGMQPMRSYSGRYEVVFNGEIYNVDKIKRIIGGQTRWNDSESDTVLLLELIDAVGVRNAISEIDGMFGMCIVDRKENCTYLTRDHVGIKPLYYRLNKKEAVFASEVKGIIRTKTGVKKQIKEESVIDYLLFGSVEGYSTMYEDIYAVEPGTIITFTPSQFSLNVRKEQYWRVPEFTTECCGNAEKLDNELKKCVEEQMVSDVRVGAQLSGGIDSSIISYYATKLGCNELYTVNVCSDELSEMSWANQAGKTIGIMPKEIKLTEQTMIDNIDICSYYLDNPLTHPNSVGIYELGKGAAGSVKVLLAGEGADELFGGYSRYGRSTFGGRIGTRVVREMTRRLGSERLLRTIGNEGRGDKNFVMLDNDIRVEQLQKILGYEEIGKRLNLRVERLKNGRGNKWIEKILNYEMTYRLPILLERQDKMLMANGVEGRVPFTSKKLIETVRSIYSTGDLIGLEMNGTKPTFVTKKTIKRMAAEKFGKDFCYRRKMGFGMPLEGLISSKKWFERIEYGCKLVGIRKPDELLNRSERCALSNQTLLFRLGALATWDYALNK